MKAYISVLLTVIVIVTYFNHIKCQERDAALKQVFGQCSQKHQISMEAIKKIVNHEDVPDDHEAKCWLSCVMEELGMIKEGKIDWDHSKNITKQGLIGEEDKAKIDKIAEICRAKAPQEEKDKCRLAYSAALCQIKYWKELGLPKGNMEL